MIKFCQDTIGVQRKNSISDLRMEQFLEEVEATEIIKAEVMRELDKLRELHTGSLVFWLAFISPICFFLHVYFILF